MSTSVPSPGSQAPSLVHQDVPDPERRFWIKAVSITGGIAAVATAVPLVGSFEPSAKTRAAGGPIEVSLADIAPGATKIVEWRGKPIWVVHRTPLMIKELEGHDDALADPRSERDQQPPYARNGARSIQPEFFVAIAICTHLGCSPNVAPLGANNPSLPSGWPGGYFCPCHGSTFDGAGRVFKNKPAPTNLEVPPYHFLSDSSVEIGTDKG